MRKEKTEMRIENRDKKIKLAKVLIRASFDSFAF